MKLTPLTIKNSPTKAKSYKLNDGNELYLHILNTGGRVWRYKFKFNNKEKLLTIGKSKQGSSTNGFTLQQARVERSKAHGSIANGIDPAQQKANIEAQNEIDNPSGKSFKEVSYEWIKYKSLQILLEAGSNHIPLR